MSVVSFDTVGARMAQDGSVGLVFMKDGREVYYSDACPLKPGDTAMLTCVVGTLRVASEWERVDRIE